jgi:biofilm PGA synthesis N-glycosyltransferase PgaC
MEVAVGVMAYNEERNIGMLLESLLGQRLKRVRIREIIVVSSGSTDRTDEIVRGLCKKDKRIRLVTEPERAGKARAINVFLGLAKTDVVVLSNADIVPEGGAIEGLCLPLLDDRVGITIARPISGYSKESLLGYSTNLVWNLYHFMTMERPKFGELMGFRRVFDGIEETSVDEEFIGMLVTRGGLGAAYVPEAIYYNFGPRTLKGFIRQRRRIFAGHLFLKMRKGHTPPSMNIGVVRSLRRVDDKRILYILLAMGLEGLARSMGLYDYLVGREEIVWGVAR